MSDAKGRIRIAEHQSEQGAWRIATLAAQPRMAGLVSRMHAWDEHGTRFTRRRELPSGHAVLIFNLGAELRVTYPADARSRFDGGSGFYCGANTTYAVTETDGAQQGVQVMLTLPGARRLLGCPLAATGDGLTDPTVALGSAAGAVADRLMQARTPAQRLAVLEDAMALCFARDSAAPRDLTWAWQRLRRSAGRVRVSELARELGCSRKHLTTRFHQEFGLPPKLFARILRFDRAVRVIRADQLTSWSELAAIAGYADQAHLVREFQGFTGASPAALLRRRLPDDGGFVD